jgi:hypothetical protein
VAGYLLGVKLLDRLRTRRQQKARRRHELEREQRKERQARDAQDAVVDVARQAGPTSFPFSS